MKSLRNDTLLIMLLLITGTPLWAQNGQAQIAVGNTHSVVLDENGHVYTFGVGVFGELGHGGDKRMDIPRLIESPVLEGKTVVDISASPTGHQLLLLTSDGEIYGAGDNGQSQFGMPGTVFSHHALTRVTHVALDTATIISVHAGQNFSFFLSNNGTVFTMGVNNNGFLGTGILTSPILTPTPMDLSNLNGEKVVKLATSANHRLLLTDAGNVYAVGENSDGQFGNGNNTSRTIPVAVPMTNFAGKTVKDVYAASGISRIITTDGSQFVMGNFNDLFGMGPLTQDILSPTQVTHPSLEGKAIASLATLPSNYASTIMVANDGSVFVIGENPYGLLGIGNFNTVTESWIKLPAAHFDNKTIVEATLGTQMALFRASDGTVYGSGLNAGTGCSNHVLHPLPLNTSMMQGKTITKMASSSTAGFLLSSDGKVFMFTPNKVPDSIVFDGAFRGIFDRNTSKTTPTRLEYANLNGHQIVKVAAGGIGTFLMTSEGKVFSFGRGATGSLGLGDSVDVYVPTLITHANLNGKKIVDIAVNETSIELSNSRSHALLLAEDGTVFAMGSNNHGQLGLGDGQNRFIPTPVTTNLVGKTIIHVAVGAENSMAIASDGSVYLWGRGGNGEMGFGNINDLNVPTLATHLSSLGKTFVKGAIGHRSNNPHFMVLADDGTVFGFGTNTDGQLGLDNGRVNQYTPTQITAAVLTGKKIVDVIASIDASTLLLAETGEVYGMGRAYTMGFTEGLFRDYEVPTLINSTEVTGRRVVGIGLKNQHSMFLLEDGRLLTARSSVSNESVRGVLGNATEPSEVRLHLPVLDFTTYASPVPTGNLALHLDAGRLGFIPSNDSVSTWSNLAVSGQNGAQSTTASRPVVVDSVMNNRPALRFNGSNQFFTLPTAADLGIQNNDYEVFMVARSADSGIQFLLGGETIAQHELHLNGSAGVRFIPASDPSRYVDVGSAGTFTNGQTQLFTVQASSTYGEVAVNRNPSTRVNASMHSPNAGVVYLGRRTDNSFYFNGDIAEVIIYNRVLSGPERGQIQDYLMGKYGITNSISSSVTLTGSEGWRLLASPVADSSYATLLSPLWTQGIPGAKSAVGNPNVYTWDATATGNASTNWLPLPQLNAPMQPGTGALVYVFSDDNYTDPGDAGFPKTLTAEGIEPLGTQNLSSLLNGNVDGWALVGNPFRHDIRWNALTKTNVYNAVYVYDNATAGWKSWNGTTGSLSNGTIGGFNGFLVQTMGSTPQLQIPDSAKTYLNQAFLGKQRTPMVLALHVQNEYGFGNTAWMHFSGEGEEGLDASDAVQLAPMQEDYVQVSTALNDTLSLDISHLPLGKSHYELPLRIASSRAGRHTLSMHEHSLPEGWVVELQDTYTQRWIELSTAHTFEIEAQEVGKIAPIGIDQVPTPFTVAAPGMERFILHIRVGETVSVEESLLPRTYELAQNYPNPFNPTTTIQYQLPEGVQVRLEVYNLLGQRVARLVNERKSAGVHQVVFDAGQLSSGMYLYRITAGEYTAVKRLVVIK